jgi:hypothetical protein
VWYIFAHILHITGSVQIIFIYSYTIKYDNVYSTLNVNSHMRYYEKYIKRYNWDISLENRKGFALFLICLEYG